MSCVVTKLAHDLSEVYRDRIRDGEYAVTQWCRHCGGVVIDGEYDGRVAPGAFMRMTFPQLAYEAAKGAK